MSMDLLVLTEDMEDLWVEEVQEGALFTTCLNCKSSLSSLCLNWDFLKQYSLYVYPLHSRDYVSYKLYKLSLKDLKCRFHTYMI